MNLYTVCVTNNQTKETRTFLTVSYTANGATYNVRAEHALWERETHAIRIVSVLELNLDMVVEVKE